LQRGRDAQLWAAATLFRLTGEDRFNRIALNGLRRYRALALDAAWEYANARQVGVDMEVQEKLRRGIVVFTRNNIIYAQRRRGAYRNMKHFWAPMGWGQGLAPSHEVAAALIRAHRITASDEFLATMLDGSAHILGANQIGMSFTVGLGHRWPTSPLHADSIAAGVPPPPGITIYGWAPPATMLGTYWYVWGPKWAALSDAVPTRRVEPPPASLPLYEFLIDYPRIVISAEYTVHQTIVTTAAVWSYLHGYHSGADVRR
jgi:endoglucanase